MKMSRNSRKKRQKPAFEYDDALFDDDLDLEGVGDDILDLDWELNEKPGRRDARRRIERHREMQRLYSELDDWEEFGSRYDM